MEESYFKVAGFNLKSNIPPWAFFTFFKLYKWYQIAQNINYKNTGLAPDHYSFNNLGANPKRYNKENILPISDQCSNFIPMKILARKGIIFRVI